MMGDLPKLPAEFLEVNYDVSESPVRAVGRVDTIDSASLCPQFHVFIEKNAKFSELFFEMIEIFLLEP